MPIVSRITTVIAALLLAACTTAPKTSSGTACDAVCMEARFGAIKSQPARLTAFLRAMPKGADLHSHLSGAVYAESYIAWAEADGLCLEIAAQRFARCDGARNPAQAPVTEVAKDPVAYNALIDALSTRNHDKGRASGHDQFFATFERFGAAGGGRGPDMLVEVVSRAAAQNIHYLELMTSPGMGEARGKVSCRKNDRNEVPATCLSEAVDWPRESARFLDELLRRDLSLTAHRAAEALAQEDRAAREKMGCDGVNAGGASAPSACAVTVRYLAQVRRTAPKVEVYAQIALGFMLAQHSAQVVGINLVAPEDDRIALADYSDHMRMIGALRRHFPGIGISLHAGELTLGLVPPEALRFHIAEAVRVAGAKRIGHGVDILYEDEPEQLLAEMARNGVMVEINLTSNAVILGVAGADHPFATYRAFGVPMALSTDDEGVARIDLTHEYRRAVMTYDLAYADVKRLSRNGLTHAFIGGDSLWLDTARALPVAACRQDALGAATPSVNCAEFLRGSAKATLQWALEAAYRRFEEVQGAARH